ncbi:hypothetical protein ACC792_37685, partial [Rhizobium ruizarguesonis]
HDYLIAIRKAKLRGILRAHRDIGIVRSGQGELTAQLKVDRRFPKGLVFVPENYRALRLNRLLRRGEYPCAVEVQKAHATLE